MLEICTTPNPTLNLPDSVDTLQNWYKSAFVDATVLFELPYMQIWAGLLNRSYTGFEPELLTSQLRLHTPWATQQNYLLGKPIDIKLDMCDTNVQKHQFSNFPAY